jgi:hypothetical protein
MPARSRASSPEPTAPGAHRTFTPPPRSWKSITTVTPSGVEHASFAAARPAPSAAPDVAGALRRTGDAPNGDATTATSKARVIRHDAAKFGRGARSAIDGIPSAMSEVLEGAFLIGQF